MYYYQKIKKFINDKIFIECQKKLMYIIAN